MQNFSRVDPAHDRGNGEAQNVAQGFFRRHQSLFDRLSVAAHGFHSKRRDSASNELRQDLPFEASIGRIEDVQRQLARVEGKVIGEHIKMKTRVLVAGEPDEPHLALPLGLH